MVHVDFKKKKYKTAVDYALTVVSDSFTAYENSCHKRHRELADIRDEVQEYNFNWGKEKRDESLPSTKVNFAKDIENKVIAHVLAKPINFVVTWKHGYAKAVADFDKIDEDELKQWPEFSQIFLNNLFSKKEMKTLVKRFVRSLVRYGVAYMTPEYKKDIYRYLDKNSKSIKEKLKEEKITLDNLQFDDVFFDARFLDTHESNGVIRRHDKVTMKDLVAQKDQFIINDLKSVKYLANERAYNINPTKEESKGTKVKDGEFVLYKYQGYVAWPESVQPRGRDLEDGFYEIWTLNNLMVLKIQAIPKINIKSCVLFEDTHDHFGNGLVEPIMSLEKLYNYRENLHSLYLNKNLFLNRIISDRVNVKDLLQLNRTGGYMTVNGSVADFLNNDFYTLDAPRIDPNYFSAQQLIQRHIQSLSYTIDTTQGSSQQGFTNTATGVRARFYEANVVYAYILDTVETFFAEIAYDILDIVASRFDNDIVLSLGKNGEDIKKIFNTKSFEMSPLKYNIDIESGSSSFESIESKRENAIAMYNLIKDMANSGAEIDLDKANEKVLETFEKINYDQLKKEPNPDMMSGSPLEQMMGGRSKDEPTQKQIKPEPQEPSLEDVSGLTQDVVQGNIQ